MERVEGTESTIEVFENDIELYLQAFKEENEIEHLRAISQSVWNSALRYIYKHVFKGNKDALKAHSNITVEGNSIASTFNRYDYDLLNELVDYYILEMCMKYDKEVSIIGFSILTGIDTDTINTWGNTNSNNINNSGNYKANGSRLSSSSCVIYKKLNYFREESLSNKLATGNKNPVGILAILNRHYQWNLPGVSKEQSKPQLSASELPKFEQISANPSQLPIIEGDEKP